VAHLIRINKYDDDSENEINKNSYDNEGVDGVKSMDDVNNSGDDERDDDEGNERDDDDDADEDEPSSAEIRGDNSGELVQVINRINYKRNF
jgi:hypothetical protein